MLSAVEEKQEEIRHNTGGEYELIKGQEDVLKTNWKIVRLVKEEYVQDILRMMQLAEDYGHHVIDLDYNGTKLPYGQEGRGRQNREKQLIAGAGTQYDFDVYLDNFYQRLKGVKVGNNGSTVQLFFNEQKIKNGNDLIGAAERVIRKLQGMAGNISVDRVISIMRDEGLELGWGATVDKVIERLGKLIDIKNLGDLDDLGDEVKAAEIFNELDRMTPTTFSATLVSTHGYFVQDNAFGKPDTGGQVSYVRDQATSLYRNMAKQMKDAGIPGEPVVIILTRLLPETRQTTSDQEVEKVEGDENVYIVRVPFRDLETAAGRQNTAYDKAGKTQKFIQRFEVFDYLMQEEIIQDMVDKIKEVLKPYGYDQPQLMIGNYSDGNLTAVQLARAFEKRIPVGIIAHALELSKYKGVEENWYKTKNGEYLAFQALVDAIVQVTTDFIITSTNLEIDDQYSRYNRIEFEGMYDLLNGIQTTDDKFNVIPPSVDRKNLFFGKDDPRRAGFVKEKKILENRIFADPKKADQVFDRVDQWKDASKPFIMTMARFDDIKNIAHLVEEFGKASLKEHANLLIIGGDVRYRQEGDEIIFGYEDTDTGKWVRVMDAQEESIARKIIKIVNDYGLQGHIRWVSASKIPRESAEMYRVVADHSVGGIFAQPASYEAFGLTVLAAMASGLMVVATNQGGPAEIITNGVDGYLANPTEEGAFGNALLRAMSRLKDEKRRNKMLKAERKRLDTAYNWDVHAQNVLEAAKVYQVTNELSRKMGLSPLDVEIKNVFEYLTELNFPIVKKHLIEVFSPSEQVELESQVAASPITPGGINLNPNLLDLQIKRNGNGIPLPVFDQPIEEMNINGFVPVIINVTPINNLPMLLGLDYTGDEEAPLDSAQGNDLTGDISYLKPDTIEFVDKYNLPSVIIDEV